MSTTLRPEDYEKLYEDGLWRLEQAVASNNQDDDEVTREARVLLARANFDGILQQQSKSGTRRLRQAAEAHRQSWRMETACHIQQQQQQHQESLSSLATTTTLPKNCVARQFRASVDEFFEAYPETMQQEKDMDDDSSSSSEDDELCLPSKTTKKRLDQQQQHQVINVDGDDASSSSYPTQQQQQQYTMRAQNPLPLAKPDPPRRQPPQNPYAKKPTPSSISRPPAQEQSTLPPPPQQQQQQHGFPSNSSRPSSSSSHQTGVFSYTPVEMTQQDENRRPTPQPYNNNYQPATLHKI